MNDEKQQQHELQPNLYTEAKWTEPEISKNYCRAMNQQSLELTENKTLFEFFKEKFQKRKTKGNYYGKQNFRDVENGNRWKFLFTFR